MRGMEGREAKRRRQMEQSRRSSQERRAQGRGPQEHTAGWTLRPLPSGQSAPGRLPPLNPDYRRRYGGTSQSQGCLCFSNPRQSQVFLHPGLADAPGPPGPCHTHSPPPKGGGAGPGWAQDGNSLHKHQGDRVCSPEWDVPGTAHLQMAGGLQDTSRKPRPREGKGPTQVTQQWWGSKP